MSEKDFPNYDKLLNKKPSKAAELVDTLDKAEF